MPESRLHRQIREYKWLMSSNDILLENMTDFAMEIYERLEQYDEYD